MWGGRFSEPPSEALWRFTVDHSDRRLLHDDLDGSLAHVAMLGQVGILDAGEVEAISNGLLEIRAESEAYDVLPLGAQDGTALRAQELAPGALSAPFRASAGYIVLRLLERTPDRVPPFEEVAGAVRAEWTRARGERALRGFLDDLRAGAELEVADLNDGEAP